MPKLKDKPKTRPSQPDKRTMAQRADRYVLYGLSVQEPSNEAEFFAVAVENFFERPRKLAKSDPELYTMLCDYFGQDPAAQPQPRRRGSFH